MQKKSVIRILTMLLVVAMMTSGCALSYGSDEVTSEASSEISETESEENEEKSIDAEQAETENEIEKSKDETEQEKNNQSSSAQEGVLDGVIKIDPITYYTTSRLNVRKGPGTDYEKSQVLSANKKIVVVGKTDNGWFLLEDGGFVSGDYLSAQKPKTQGTIVTEVADSGSSSSGSSGSTSSSSGSSDSTSSSSGNSGSSDSGSTGDSTGGDSGSGSEGGSGTEGGSGSTDPEEEISVQIMPFGSEEERLAAHMELRDSGNYSGKSQYVTLADGTECLQLLYHSYSNLAAYRCTPYFTEADCVDADHKYVRVTYMTDYELPGTITFLNSANGNQRITAVEDTSVSKGEWVTSAPIDISGSGIIEGAFMLQKKDVLISFSAKAQDVKFYIKEITFFETEEDAYAYYGDEPDTTSIPYRVLTYDTNGTAIKKDTHIGRKNEYVEFDEALGIANIKEADGTQFMNKSDYYIDLMFDLGHIYNESYKYMRVHYSAKNPEGVDAISMTLYNLGNGYDCVTFEENLVNTDGFVLSETVELQPTLTERFQTPNANRLTFDTLASGGEYKVKTVYFFKTQEAADALKFNNNHTLTIKGTDISEYNIIVAKDCDEVDLNLAQKINARIFDLTGKVLNIVTDDNTETAYEIVIGKTNRSVSNAFYGTNGIYNATSADYDFDGYQATMTGNKLVFASAMKAGLEELIENYLGTYLYSNKIYIPEIIELTDESVLTGNYGDMGTQAWPDAENVDDPEQFTDDFSEDTGYWTEESGEDNWSVKESDAAGNYKTLFHAAEGGTYNTGALNSGGTVNDDYTLSAAYNNTNYSLGLALNGSSDQTSEDRFMRVLYSAKNPEGVETVSMTLRNNGNGNDYVTIASDITSTDGYTLSPTVELPEDNDASANNLLDRFVLKGVNTLIFDTAEAGGEYKVKAVYFFKTQEEADTAVLNVSEENDYKCILSYGENGTGNGLEHHSQMMSDPDRAITALEQSFMGQGYVFRLLFSNANYYNTAYKYMRVLYSAKNPEGAENVSMMLYNNGNGNDCLTIASDIIDTDGYVLSDVVEIPSTSGIGARFTTTGSVNTLTVSPTQIGGEYKIKAIYFYETQEAAEAAGKVNMNLDMNAKEGYYSSEIAEDAVSYLHVYEKNVSFEADMICEAKEAGADMGLILRYTAKDAYVKAGYDFDKAEWYVENREGIDFECYRIASAPATVNVGDLYKVKAVIDNRNLTLYVNDAEVLSTGLITQVTPGRIGVYADNAKVNVDNVDIKLLSGMGQIVPNVVHSVLPSDTYTEGGSVMELSNGTLVYEHWSGTTFKSNDHGKTWTSASTWTASGNIYPNILRLANNDFIKIMHEYVDNVWSEVVYRSSDDGNTWNRVGVISPVAHTEITASAGNMNDKLTQMSDGRIFYGQNYQGSGRVFCEIWYSDDNGETWTKSQTPTYEIEGNEEHILFGECKVMETSDNGKLRMYCSWNEYGHIVYSESTDNGVTWGTLQHMNDFVCSRSSMQFMKDKYADNNTTYYMVWCYGSVGRTRLALAKTTDGMNWEYLGDVWRWETNYTHNDMLIAHIVDPFITVTEDYIIVGSGISEETDDATYQNHQKQRQHIWSIKKDTLTPYDSLPYAY